MKKIYFSLFVLSLTSQISQAQLTLTKATNEPIVGNIFTRQRYDSTTAVPKAIGAGQNWNFTSLVTNTLVEVYTYTTVASTPSPAIYPGATISEDQGGGKFIHYKSTASTLEYQGIQFPGAIINFSNTGISATWPIAFGYNANDIFGGSTTTGTLTASIAGSINVNAAGSGTVVLPGGTTLTNCLQVINTISFLLTSGTSTQTQVQKEYSYYHSSNKFPVLSIQYQSQTSGTLTTTNVTIRVNPSALAAIKINEISNDFSIFPNPCNELLNVAMNNVSGEQVNVSFTNVLGQIVKNENLGNEISILANINVSDLLKGIYFVNIKTGQKSSMKKIVIE